MLETERVIVMLWSLYRLGPGKRAGNHNEAWKSQLEPNDPGRFQNQERKSTLISNHITYSKGIKQPLLRLLMPAFATLTVVSDNGYQSQKAIAPVPNGRVP